MSIPPLFVSFILHLIPEHRDDNDNITRITEPKVREYYIKGYIFNGALTRVCKCPRMAQGYECVVISSTLLNGSYYEVSIEVDWYIL